MNNIFAGGVCLPLVLFPGLLEKSPYLRSLVEYIPLFYCRHNNFNINKINSLDCFTIPIGKKLSKSEIKGMSVPSELKEIVFLINQPYLHAIGEKD